MALTLPIVQDTAWFSFAVELDGRTFTLTFRWNDRGGFWVLDIADADGTPLARGAKVVINAPLLSPFVADPRVPQGEIVALDTSGRGLDANFDDLGRRVHLVYLTAAEVAAL